MPRRLRRRSAFTAATFANDTEYESQGNASFDEIVDWVGTTLPEFWSEVFPAAYGSDFAPRRRELRRHRAGLRAGVENRDLGYCTDDTTVYLDETDLAALAYGEIGDFALATAMSPPYSPAVRDQAGPPTTGRPPVRPSA